MKKEKKPPYKKPEIRTFEPGELREELGVTNGSTGKLDLQGGGST